MKIQCPRCPLCDQPPELAMSAEQAFCANPDCGTLCWDTTQTLDWNLTNSTVHDISGWPGE